MTLSKITYITFSITIKCAALSIKTVRFFIPIQNVVMQDVVILNVIMLDVIILNSNMLDFIIQILNILNVICHADCLNTQWSLSRCMLLY
jgi:hypothetical protein